MSRIRSVHPGLWTDERFVGLSCDAQIFFVGLWTEADDQGVFPWKPLTLRMRLRPTKDGAVDPILEELIAADEICRFEVAGRPFGAIRNFCLWQKPRSPSAVHPAPDEIMAYVGCGNAPCSAQTISTDCGNDQRSAHAVSADCGNEVSSAQPVSTICGNDPGSSQYGVAASRGRGIKGARGARGNHLRGMADDAPDDRARPSEPAYIGLSVFREISHLPDSVVTECGNEDSSAPSVSTDCGNCLADGEERRRVEESPTSTPDSESESPVLVGAHSGENSPPPQPRATSGGATRAKRLDKDFQMPAEWLVEAVELRRKSGLAPVNALVEAEKFTDFWHAKAGRDGTKLDWHATWRNWIRNSRSTGYGSTIDGGDAPHVSFGRGPREPAPKPDADGKLVI